MIGTLYFEVPVPNEIRKPTVLVATVYLCQYQVYIMENMDYDMQAHTQIDYKYTIHSTMSER